jgi:hypothetical protein
VLWVLRKFGWLIALATALLGIVYLPADFLEREEAYKVLFRTFTVGNREILLAILCGLCLGRLLYLDMRRALNEADWPPMKQRLIRGLSFLFRRDFRLAQFKAVTDDTLIRAAWLSIQAERIKREFPLLNIQAPPLPTARSPEDYTRVMDRHSYWITTDAVGEALDLILRIVTRTIQRDPDIQALKASYRASLGEVAMRAEASRPNWHLFENSAVFPDEKIRLLWHVRREEASLANSLIERLKSRLSQLSSSWKAVIPDEDGWRRLLQELELERLP